MNSKGGDKMKVNKMNVIRENGNRRTLIKSKVILSTLGLLINSIAANGDIEATEGFGTTVTKSQENVYDITTSKIKDNNAFNSFDKFHLNQNNIANLHFGSKGGAEAENLFNLVNGQIKVDGLINGIRNNKIGGNLYFLSSEGLIIGKTGVINAGTFHSIIPKKEEYEKVFKEAQNAKVLAGIIPVDGKVKIPLNPNGSITVEGKINTVEEIGLYAANIKLKDTARLKTGVTEFKNLVNISETINARLTGDLKATKTRSGDIVLSAHVDSPQKAMGEDSSVGKKMEEYVKGSTKANIESDAVLEADGDVKISAKATNGTLIKKEKEKEVYNTSLSLSDVEAHVRVNRGKIIGKNVDITAEAKNIYEATLVNKFSKKSFSFVTGSLSPINLNGALGLLTSKSSITIGKEAKVEASEGKANIHSYSGLRATMEAATSPLKMTNLYGEKADGKLASVGAAYISGKSKSDVVVEGEVKSKGKADITSKSENTIKASVEVETIRDSNKIGSSVLITEGENHSSINITREAKIESEDDVNIKSETVNSIETSVKSGLGDNGSAVVAANISNYNSSSKVQVNGIAHAKKRLNVEAYNSTKNNVVQTGSQVGTSKMANERIYESEHVKGLVNAIKERFGASTIDENTKSKLTDLFSAGVSAGIVNHNNSASVTIGESGKLYSGVEGSNIKALNRVENLRATTSSGSLALRKEEQKKAVANAAVFYGNYKNNASVAIASQAELQSEGKIDTNSENKIEYNNPSQMAKAVVDKLEVLKRAFEKEEKNGDEYNPKDIESMQKLLKAFSEKIDGKPEMLINGEKITMILPDGNSKTGTAPEIADYIQGEMKKLQEKLPKGFKAFSEGLSGLLKEALNFTEVGNYANFHTFTSAGVNGKQNVSSGGGAVSWVEMDNHSKVSIEKGAKIAAKKDLNIEAINKTETINIVGKTGISKSSDSVTAVGGELNVQKSNTSAIIETKEKAALSGENIHVNARNNVFHVGASFHGGSGGNTINGIGSYSGGTSTSRVSIDDEAYLNAKKKVSLDSKNNTSVTNVAGVAAIGEENAAVGVAVAINNYNISNKASIEDHDNGESKYDKDPKEVTVRAESLEVKAETTGKIHSVSVSGRANQAGSDGKEGILKKIGNKVDSIKNTITSTIDSLTDKLTERIAKEQKNIENLSSEESSFPSKVPSFTLGAVGSSSINNINKATSAVVKGGTIELKGENKKVEVLSSDSTFIGSWSGTPAIQWNHIGEGNSNVTIGLAGAVAINNIHSKTKTLLKDSNIQNVNIVKVNALNGGTHAAAGAGVEAVRESGGKGKSFLLGISGSSNLVDNEITSESENNIVTGEAENKKVDVDVTAYGRDTQVTGGFNLQAGKSKGTVGSAFTVAKLGNKIKSGIKGGSYTNVNRIDAKALLATTQVTSALSAGGIKSSDSGFGNYQGAISVNTINNDVFAAVDKSSIKDAKELNIIAKDIKGSSELVKEYETLLDGSNKGYLESRGIDVTGKKYYTEEQLKEANKRDGAVIVNAAVSVAGSDKISGGAGVAVNIVKNKFKAELSGTEKTGETPTINAQKINVDAKSSTVIVNTATGLAISKSSLGGIGSFGWQELENESTAKVQNLNAKANDFNINAGNQAFTVNVGGSIAGSSTTAVGAALAYNSLKNKTSASLTNSHMKAFSGINGKMNVNVKALNDSHVNDISAGVTVGMKQVEVGGMVSINRGSDETEALVSGSEFEGVNSFNVDGKDKKILNTIAGNINGGKEAGIGGTVAHTDIRKQSVTVAVKNSKIVTAKNQDKKDIHVTAKDSAVTNTIAAGVGGAKGIAAQGASASTTLNKIVSSHVEQTDIDNDPEKENNANKQKANFNVLAENTSEVLTNATVLSVAGGQVGIGAGIAVNKITQNTSADIENSTQNIRNSIVKSKANSSIKTIGIGAGVGAGGTGVSGSVAINKITNNNTASIERSNIFAQGNVGVVTESNSTISNYAGTVSGGSHVGIGGSVSVNEVKGETLASVKNSKIEAKEETEDTIEIQGTVKEVVEKTLQNLDINNDLNKKREKLNKTGLVVNSSSTHTVKSLLANAAGAGKVGVAGTVNVNNISGETKTIVENSLLQAKNSSIHAGDYTNSIGVVGSASGALNAGIGASSDTNIFKRNTKTRVYQTKISSEKQGEALEITADSKQGISSFGVGLGVAGVGAGVAGTVSVNQLSGKTEVEVENSHISVKEADIFAKHYGVVSTGNGSVGGAVKGAGIGAAVAVMKDLTNTNLRIKNSEISTKTKLDAIAKNHIKLNSGIVGVGVAGIGVGLAGTVSVNNITGKVGTEVDHSALTSEKDINIKALNTVDSSTMAAGGALGLGAVSGVVSVNTINTSVVTRVDNYSDIMSKGTVNIKAEEDKNIKQTVASAGDGVVSVGANVLVNHFGTAVEDKKDEKGKGTAILKTLEEINKEQDGKISGAAADILKLNGVDTKTYAVKAEHGNDQAEGIKVFVKNSWVNSTKINVGAKQEDNITSTGGAGTAGVASALGTVGITNIKRDIGAVVDNSYLKAIEKLSVRSDIAGNTSLTSYQGTVGALGLGAAYSEITATGKSNVSIKNSKLESKHIDVISKDKSELKAEAKGLTAGAVAAGAIISKANNEMNADVEIEKSIFNEEKRENTTTKGIGREINIKVEKENRVTAESQGASVGAMAGAGIISNATDTGKSQLKVKKNSGRSIFHADDVNMEAVHKMKVTAGSKAVTGTVLGGIGVTKAEAVSAGKVMVEIEEGNLFRTNRLNVNSKVEGLDEDKVTAKSSVVSGNGGGIAGAGVNTSRAESNTESVVRLLRQDYENNDYTKKYVSEVNAIASNDTKNIADIKSLEVAGVYAQGTNKAFTKSDKLTSTTTNGGEVCQLRVKALVKNESYGNVKGSGGALVGAETATYENYTKSITGTTVAGNWEIGDTLESIAKENNTVKIDGDGTKGGLVGKNGLSIKNEILGSTKSFIGEEAKVVGTGNVSVEAVNELDIDLQGKSGGYGGYGVGNVEVHNELNKDATVRVDKSAVVDVTGKQEYQALTKGKVNLLGSADAAAAGAIANARVIQQMNITNLVKQDVGSQLKSKEKDITLAASNQLNVKVDGKAESKGAGAKSDAHIKNQITRKDGVVLAGKIKTDGNLNVYRGYDKNHQQSEINSDVNVESKSYALAAFAKTYIENNVQSQKIAEEEKSKAELAVGKLNVEETEGHRNVNERIDRYTWHSSEKKWIQEK